MIKACVIGAPISHSRSPLIHRHWLKIHGIDGSYERKHVEPADLQTFFTELKQGAFAGCNVTLPHKEAAMSLVDHVDERATRIGALNTVYLRDGQLHGTSSDGCGFHANLQQSIPGLDLHGATILVLGAGGSARAIVDEMLRNGAAHIVVTNRTPERAVQLAEFFGNKVVAANADKIPQHTALADIIINTTSAGIADTSPLSLPFELARPGTIVADINYVPLVTSLLRDAEAHGLRIVPGLGMLLHQAVTGFELWFGVRPVVTPELYDLIATDVMEQTPK